MNIDWENRHPLEVDQYIERQGKLRYIYNELEIYGWVRKKTMLEWPSLPLPIVFTDIVWVIHSMYPSSLEMSLKILKLWDTDYDTIESQSDECISLILDLLP